MTMGRIYTAAFTEVAATAQQDMFQIEAQTTPVIIHACYISQTSDVGDSAAENLSVLIRRVTDDVTNATTEQALDGGDAAANADINVNQTTELVTGAATLHSEAWNIHQSYIYLPPPELRPVVQVGNAICVNLNTTPADSITISGTLYFEEIGN